MKQFTLAPLFGAIALVSTQFATAQGNQSFDGSLELEQRVFTHRLDDAGDANRGQTSLRLQMEYFRDWNNGSDQIVLEPFVRIDSDDEARSHLDLRQFLYSKIYDNAELSVGLGRVFWGVTESQHLVDIINQTDGVENIDGEDKLGQPMIRYTYFADFGTLEAFALPYFRPRTLAGKDSRLNGGLMVRDDVEHYEASSGTSHFDYAVRYKNTFGDWDLGLSWFDGTSRDPDLRRFANPLTGATEAYYAQITQVGLDLQLTTGAWLYKLEAIQRDFDDASYASYSAATVGTEYTLVGILNSVYDLSLLAEYAWDERDAPLDTVFQNDLFVGARLALNDMADSQILFGVSNDLDETDSRAWFVEGSTRIGTATTLNIEARIFDAESPSDPLSRFDQHSFIQVGLEYFFD
ncbi:hypothetical protein GCM10008090_28150 [Arenicella chitinivorans]|uniref:Porin n=1 Tax=Arenicella chitinivorans TaxID=1329800 RepID=A0A918RZQ7_9GAMM|nr:hypothetical protein [Arenicella chitinivorans]GHA16861.1 hypothetical protein GCM10008090_28150 [Arenicella chitinivorans]